MKTGRIKRGDLVFEVGLHGPKEPLLRVHQIVYSQNTPNDRTCELYPIDRPNAAPLKLHEAELALASRRAIRGYRRYLVAAVKPKIEAINYMDKVLFRPGRALTAQDDFEEASIGQTQF